MSIGEKGYQPPTYKIEERFPHGFYVVENTGEHGTPLREILDKPYEVIECRCLWKDENENVKDDLFGYCKWDGENLIPLDGDSYSLEDLYIKWESDGDRLTVWEDGYLSEEWRN